MSGIHCGLEERSGSAKGNGPDNHYLNPQDVESKLCKVLRFAIEGCLGPVLILAQVYLCDGRQQCNIGWNPVLLFPKTIYTHAGHSVVDARDTVSGTGRQSIFENTL